jgi:hypothetical protein
MRDTATNAQNSLSGGHIITWQYVRDVAGEMFLVVK